MALLAVYQLSLLSALLSVSDISYALLPVAPVAQLVTL